MIRSSNKVLAVLFLVGGLIWLLAAIYNYQYEMRFIFDPIYYMAMGGYLWILPQSVWIKRLQLLLIILAVLILLGTMLNWALKLSLSPMTVIIFCLLMDEDALKKKGK